MRFTLTYQGPLPPTGNSKSPRKHAEILSIREKFSSQLSVLWGVHPALKLLNDEGWIYPTLTHDADWQFSGHTEYHGLKRLTAAERAAMHPELGLVPLAGPIQVGAKNYKPLIRKSLNLACELSILFLRQGDPGQLIRQDGDLDNRVKTLLDALKIPTKEEQELEMPKADHIYCLMENDSLVSALDVSTDRLLVPVTEENENEVHLIIEVSVRVLMVNRANVCLL